MNIGRLFKHLLAPRWLAARHFGPALSAEVGAAVVVAESNQRGELRFVVEGPIPFVYLWHGHVARQRADDLFAQLRVWDTEEKRRL